MIQPRRLGGRRRGEDGTSSIELVLYMPLLFLSVLLAVQFCLMYLGNQVASAAAREGARTARVTQNEIAAHDKAVQWVNDLGKGALEDPVVTVAPEGVDNVRVTVSGKAMKLIPWIPIPRVSETIVGPIEQFIPDTAVGP